MQTFFFKEKKVQTKEKERNLHGISLIKAPKNPI
jgi:hypothetical protein